MLNCLPFIYLDTILFIYLLIYLLIDLSVCLFIYLFIDLFAFIIKMPTMHRLSVFRDDIVFLIYLYQRWIYRIDTSRPVEK